MNCPKCKSEARVKNGHRLGKQRWKCKACGCQYTRNDRRRRSDV